MNPYLQLALAQAQLAFDADEVPVGAVIVLNDQVIAAAHNQKESQKNPVAHAEILAITQAAHILDDWRLTDAVMYSTLEPCPMCAGAILHARLKQVVFGAHDLKWGAAGTIVNLFDSPKFNHSVEVTYLPTPECAEILTRFFQQRRKFSQ